MSRVTPSTNWAGNVAFRAVRTQRPDSLEDLCRLVRGSRRVRALARGHSFSRVADTGGEFVILDDLPRRVTIDRTNATATVASWMSYTEMTTALSRAGCAVSNMASIPDISIAGACATGTHGSGDTHRVLADSVVAMRVVVANGDHILLRRDYDEPEFSGALVGLGAVGIVTALTLRIEPSYEMEQRVMLSVPLDAIAGELSDVFGSGYSVSVFTDWTSNEANVWVKRRIDRPVSRSISGIQAQGAIHPVPGMSSTLCTEQLGIVGPWHERLPHFRPRAVPGAGHELQSEVFLPRDAARRAMSELREIAGVVAPALLVSEMRTVRGDDFWLSPAYGRDSATFHFTWKADAPAAMRAIAAIEERLLPLDPRPHWGKLTTMAPRHIISSYARASEFGRLMRKYDPTGKFRNDFLDSLFPTPR